jgi:hypothetical protein
MIRSIMDIVPAGPFKSVLDEMSEFTPFRTVL